MERQVERDWESLEIKDRHGGEAEKERDGRMDGEKSASKEGLCGTCDE